MENNSKLKLFISYSHSDETYITNFLKHLAPFRNKNLIESWYDRNILAGSDFQDTIDNNLDNADMICLMISANFLSSSACIKEKKKAFELRKKKGIIVVAIILKPCLWLEDDELNPPLALPTDGKPIDDFSSEDHGWTNVCNGLKEDFEKLNKYNQVELNEDFNTFLNDSVVFTNLHSKKTNIYFDDIFVNPLLKKIDFVNDDNNKIKLSNIYDRFFDYKKMILQGNDQSGKTSICKKFFKNFRNDGYFPIYIADYENKFLGSINDRIKNSFIQQYLKIDFEEISIQKIILIIDDFHLAKKKSTLIKQLNNYPNLILIVDDIYSLNIQNENLTRDFINFKILEFPPSLRFELINKWYELNNRKSIDPEKANENYRIIDTTTEIVNNTLGTTFKKGLMPSYPFFILTIISTLEIVNDKSIDQNKTSQGHCYHALIILSLGSQGVNANEIDMYFNFLSNFAYYCYKDENRFEKSFDDIKNFYSEYSKIFVINKSIDDIINTLLNSKILKLDSFNNYTFNYRYIYYYFVSKYFAYNRTRFKDEINHIIQNLHINEYAYITIFISHHSRDIDFLDDILLNSMFLFDKYEPATLSKKELIFFDDKIDTIAKVIINNNTYHTEERKKLLSKQDDFEENNIDNSNDITEGKDNEENSNNDLSINLRKGIKTIEVIGGILRNRIGSLESTKLIEMTEEGINLQLRVLSSFFEIIRDDDINNYIIEKIMTILSDIKEGNIKSDNLKKYKDKDLTKDEVEQFAKRIFWNINFNITYSIINKIIHSLGSDRIISIIDQIETKVDNPAIFLIKHGINMWYKKNIQTQNICKRLEKKDISFISKRIIEHLIVNYSNLHKLTYHDKQRIMNKLNIPQTKLLSHNITK